MIFIFIIICVMCFGIGAYYAEKKEYQTYKKSFDDARCDEQLLDIVYNTFKLKEKTK